MRPPQYFLDDGEVMAVPIEDPSILAKVWEVFLLFSIPIGGGIPAGVLLAKKNGFGWLLMTVLYFVSDVVLAFVFEPLALLVIFASKRWPFLVRLTEAFRKSTRKSIERHGLNPGPFQLVMIAFGVDPMTGRSAALAAGHGFITGWAIAILGDMIFFFILMGSTLWLNSILGDGTWTAVIIMVAMMIVPPLIRRFRGRAAGGSALSEHSTPGAPKPDAR